MKKVLGCLVVLGMMPQLAGANGVNVYPGGATYTTIQAGVNACPLGGTVFVSAGIYTEAVYQKELKTLLKIGLKK